MPKKLKAFAFLLKGSRNGGSEFLEHHRKASRLFSDPQKELCWCQRTDIMVFKTCNKAVKVRMSFKWKSHIYPFFRLTEWSLGMRQSHGCQETGFEILKKPQKCKDWTDTTVLSSKKKVFCSIKIFFQTTLKRGRQHFHLGDHVLTRFWP